MTALTRALKRSVEPSYVVVLDGRTMTIRPKRSRSQEAVVVVSWDQVYRWALLKRAPKRRAVPRGLIALGREFGR